MKKTLLHMIFSFSAMAGLSQITTPVVRANFGVDADLRSNYFNNSVTWGTDDWFNSGTSGPGAFMIDTTGATYWYNLYNTNPEARKRTFVKYMNYPMYTVINGKRLYDALFVRDHHDNDSTAFRISNKNGQSPTAWLGGVQPVPAKNDIKDAMVHIRRDGEYVSDSLWFIAGLSLEGNTGNRYFDFELYQTEMYYDNLTGTFRNVGLDSGHTAWQFDAAGNVTKVGDIIFTAEFSSSELSLLEARLWVHRDELSATPVNFNWGGAFDGDGGGAAYGYANILPKGAGGFYTGMQSSAGTWAGPFGNVSYTGGFQSTYNERQFMEFSVNLTKLGLDPYSLSGISSACLLPFKRLFIKTRSSTSFTSELKDFIGPTNIGLPPYAVAAPDLSIFCDDYYAVSTISITNPLSTSLYEWSTPDGHIITFPAIGSSIRVDSPGTYIVTQTLNSACGIYARDTVIITRQPCHVLEQKDVLFTGWMKRDYAQLQLMVGQKEAISRISLERSSDGRSFYTVSDVPLNQLSNNVSFRMLDALGTPRPQVVFYRLKIVTSDGKTSYSNVIRLVPEHESIRIGISPNPATDHAYIQLHSSLPKVELTVYDGLGRAFASRTAISGERIDMQNWPDGAYYFAFSHNGQRISAHTIIKR